MDPIEKEKWGFFITIFLIDYIIFFLSHYTADKYLIHKKNNYPIVQKNEVDFLIKKEKNINKEIPKIIIQHEINTSLKKEYRFHVEIDDDKKEEYDLIYHLYK